MFLYLLFDIIFHFDPYPKDTEINQGHYTLYVLSISFQYYVPLFATILPIIYVHEYFCVWVCVWVGDYAKSYISLYAWLCSVVYP